MRHLRLALFSLGAVLLGVLVLRNDPAAILGGIVHLSWRLAVVACFPITLSTLCETLGWRFAFLGARVPFRMLLSAQLAGESFNVTTATVGGEVLKAWLLRHHAPFDVSAPSLIVAKTTIAIAQGLFLLVGVALARTIMPGSPVLYGMEGLFAVEVIALAGFVVTQASGMLGSAARLLARLGATVSAGTNALARVDQALQDVYRRGARRLTLSVIAYLLSWLLGGIEAYLILHFLGLEVSLTAATVIEAFGTATRFATFVIPASLGAVEGGYVVIFSALGLTPTAAVSFSLVKRVREVTWAGIGLVAFALMRDREPLPVPEAARAAEVIIHRC